MSRPADPAHSPRPTYALRYFEDLRLGETWHCPARTHTEALFYAFQLASGDTGEVHYNLELCKARGLPGLLAHGFQVLIQTCPGSSDMLRGESRVAFRAMLEQSSKFLKPVYAGDTLYPALTVAELKPQRTTGLLTLRTTVHNQRDELCLEGEIKLLVPRRPAAGA
ncbi:MAG: MaoC family dehydratase [Candidatus Lambdaproteobacteria bacterium]|nr:MaoC family dehydratase [Candidatus Lambdaproteobacteria bacterium]